MNSDDLDSDEEEPENYIFNTHDGELIAAAKMLLEKVARSAGFRPAQLVSVAKLQHALAHLPHANTDMDVKVSVTSPRRSFGEVETYHWWDVALEYGILRLTSGGHFYRPSTGGDTFTSMEWEAQPGEESEFSDYSDNNRIVPDLRSYEDGVASVDLAAGGYSIEVTDSDNPLLEEMDEEESEQEEEGEEEGNEEEPDTGKTEFSVSPLDATEAALAKRINETEVHSNEPNYSYGAESCDYCKCQLRSRGLFVDGRIRGEMMWANMCAPCFNSHGSGIGWGEGQLYARQPNGKWRLVAGFQPPDKRTEEF
jgi:hypothetical protein